MKREEQLKWLNVHRKGFIRHVLSYGLPFSVPLMMGSAFVRNDFYLNLSPMVSWKLYLTTMLGAIIFAGIDWCFNGYRYQKYHSKK